MEATKDEEWVTLHFPDVPPASRIDWMADGRMIVNGVEVPADVEDLEEWLKSAEKKEKTND